MDRLSFIVRAIENDCQIVPVGSLKMTCSHEVRYNDTFQGIENINLNAFMHFRYLSSHLWINYIKYILIS